MRNKKLIIILSLIISLSIVYFIFAQNESDKNKTEEEKILSKELVKELSLERDLLKKKETNLDKYKQNLESFEADLNKRYDEYLKKKKALEDLEKAFKKKVDDATLDAKIIESYENIDPEQAALLMQEMYKKDKKLPPIILRKISGKKAGKIIEALIELDTPTSAALAKDVINYFKPE